MIPIPISNIWDENDRFFRFYLNFQFLNDVKWFFNIVLNNYFQMKRKKQFAFQFHYKNRFHTFSHMRNKN